MPDRRDMLLSHCVELTCPFCGHMVRVARCQCDLDAVHLVDLYKREILLYDLECHHCNRTYCNPGAVRRVNRSREDWLEDVKLEEADA